MTDYQLPVWAETTMQIFAIITLIVCTILCIILLAWIGHSAIKTEKAKADYVLSLNEHDKSVIAKYNNIKHYAKWGRKDKKQC